MTEFKLVGNDSLPALKWFFAWPFWLIFVVTVPVTLLVTVPLDLYNKDRYYWTNKNWLYFSNSVIKIYKYVLNVNFCYCFYLSHRHLMIHLMTRHNDPQMSKNWRNFETSYIFDTDFWWDTCTLYLIFTVVFEVLYRMQNGLVIRGRYFPLFWTANTKLLLTDRKTHFV